jgi:hypothetical protein
MKPASALTDVCADCGVTGLPSRDWVDTIVTAMISCASGCAIMFCTFVRMFWCSDTRNSCRMRQ